MTKISGQTSKLISIQDNPVSYYLSINDEKIHLNPYLNKKIKIVFNGQINCINCDAAIKKTFMQGYCYPCFMKIPQTSECIFKPHLCKAHIGESRDMDWAKENCLIPTYVYLSVTSNLKVGVTKFSHIPSRWIAQGAHFAIKLAKAPNRYIAGMIEIELSKQISDRTQWRKMLQGEYDEVDLVERKQFMSEMLPSEYKQYISSDNNITDIEYPMTKYPQKIKSINMDKVQYTEVILTGIKGQYLIFNNEYVLNVRKYTGYKFDFEL